MDFENKKIKDYVHFKSGKDGVNMDKETLNRQAQKKLDIAEQFNCEDNYFFTTTFERYCVQSEILESLEGIIKESGPLIKKEYVKGRENLYTHPAITDYNKTSDSANKNVAILLRVIKTFGNKKETEPDPLLELISGCK